MQKVIKFVIIFVAILAVIAAAAGIFFLKPYREDSQALEALNSDSTISVVNSESIVIKNEVKNITKGVIIYPGGLVTPESYAVLARKIAEKGYVVIIAKFPFNLAVIDPYQAEILKEYFPTIKNWTIMGHSLGGTMAAKVVDEKGGFNRLILLAAYPANNNDLYTENVEVISIYGTEDGILNLDNLENTKSLLPKNTQYIKIPGGNHSQFGNYGQQKDDKEAKTTQDRQLKFVTDLF